MRLLIINCFHLLRSLPSLYATFAVILSLFDLLVAQVCQNSVDIKSCGVGTCINIQSSYSACLCPSGYAPTGDNNNKCQLINVCTSSYTTGNICFNGGTCSVPPGAQPGQYQCTCTSDYGGPNCQNALDICGSANCQNGSACVLDQTKPEGYYCLCSENYVGAKCEAAKEIGVGGSGAPLTTIQLILLWGLWILMALTFLYCAVNMIIDWWAGRMKKAITGAVGA